MGATINELTNLSQLLNDPALGIPEEKAKINPGDTSVTGGRHIVNVKSNQLFTGQFEESDVKKFVSIWRQYNNGNIKALKDQLLRECMAMNTNYRREVCPVEVMLYTSNIISSSFSNNVRLIGDVADVVVQICKDNEDYMQSLIHIVATWKWPQTISICAVAAGRIGDSRLMQYIYDNYHSNEEIQFSCFTGLIESGKEEFEVEILDMVRELKGHTDLERRIGNKFKNEYARYFPEASQRLNLHLFDNSSSYVKSMVSKMVVDGREVSFQGRYSVAKTQAEKKELIKEGMNRLFNSYDQPGLYDVINMFKMANSSEVSDRLYNKLDIEHKEGIRKPVVIAVISYFNTIYHEKAINLLKTVEWENTYYAAARLALFHQGIITGDELMSAFLSEKRNDQMKTYISGFYGMAQKGNAIQESSFKYLSREDLSREQLSTAISNYEKLVKKYRHLYDSNLISLICQWFGYNSPFHKSQITLADQMSCLNIIEVVITGANNKYEDFLYYVAEEGTDINYTVSNKARTILRNMHSKKIKY